MGPAIVARAYKHTEVVTDRRLLQDLARRLDDRYPSPAASVREGLEEKLTVLTLGLSDRLRQSLCDDQRDRKSHQSDAHM